MSWLILMQMLNVKKKSVKDAYKVLFSLTALTLSQSVVIDVTHLLCTLVCFDVLMN